MSTAGPRPGRNVRAYAYTLVTTAVVLLFTLAEWGTEKLLADRSRAASTAIEIAIVLIAALVFRPIHQRVEQAVEAAFYKRKRQGLASLEKFRRELSSFSDMPQLLRRVIEAVEHHLDADACAVYLRRETFRAEASSFEVAAGDVALDDPLAVRLRSSGAPARPPLLKSSARGTHAFPMTAAGDLIGFLSVHAKSGQYDAEELHMLGGLAGDLAAALVSLDPLLRAQNRKIASNIRADLPAVIGRERELGEIAQALEQSRLVTVTGAGGVGKTVLAMQCAAQAIDAYEHGVWFVDLAPITDGALVPAALLAALDAGSAADGREVARLLDHLRPRDALVVIDNCEQVVAPVATVVAEILAACPRVRILATSRELLHLEGETVYRLGSLDRAAAIELFTQRAAAASPRFIATQSADAVKSICERLDDIPLAIELAAARVRALSVEEILEHLHERFRLLTGGSRAALPRQQTLAALIEWSYGLLSDEEQSLFRRLAVFRGTFTLAAASAVCANGGDCDEYHVLDVLTSLADKSLLNVALARTTRYRLLETIREFAAQKAAECTETVHAANQHAQYFAGTGATAYEEFDSHLPEGWLERLSPDIDNFRSALDWLLDGGGDRRAGAQLAADCGPIFLRMDLLAEGLRWCEAARGIADLPPATAGRIEYVASMMHNNLGENQPALAAAERAVTFYRRSADERGLIRALSQVAQLYAREHRYGEAFAPAEDAMQRARLLREPRVLIAVLRRCAFSLPPAQLERARTLFAEALDAARAAHEPEEECMVLEWWANREAGAGDFERAMALASQGLKCAGGNAQMSLEIQLACWALALGRMDEAAPHAGRALALALQTHIPLARATAIAYYAPLEATRDARRAALLFGYATNRLEQIEWKMQDDDQLALKYAAQAIEHRLGHGEYGDLLKHGAAWSEDQALEALATSASIAADNSSGAGRS